MVVGVPLVIMSEMGWDGVGDDGCVVLRYLPDGCGV